MSSLFVFGFSLAFIRIRLFPLINNTASELLSISLRKLEAFCLRRNEHSDGPLLSSSPPLLLFRHQPSSSSFPILMDSNQPYWYVPLLYVNFLLPDQTDLSVASSLLQEPSLSSCSRIRSFSSTVALFLLRGRKTSSSTPQLVPSSSSTISNVPSVVVSEGRDERARGERLERGSGARRTRGGGERRRRVGEVSLSSFW